MARVVRLSRRQQRQIIKMNRAKKGPEITPTEEQKGRLYRQRLKTIMYFFPQLGIQEDHSVEVLNSGSEEVLQSQSQEVRQISEKEKKNRLEAALVPQVRSGKDVLVETGTSRETMSMFLLPVLEKLAKHGPVNGRNNSPRAVILASSVDTVSNHHNDLENSAKQFEVVVEKLHEEMSNSEIISRIGKGAQLIIGSFGTIMSLIEENKLSLKELKYLVFDEMHFIMRDFSETLLPVLLNNQIYTENKQSIQVLMFSKFISPRVEFAADLFLKIQPGQKDPVRVLYWQNQLSPNVKLHFVQVDGVAGRNMELRRLLANRDARGNIKKTIIYVNNENQANYLVIHLIKCGVKANIFTQSLLPKIRDRNIASFENNQLDVLIVTSRCSRDFVVTDDINQMINYEIPDFRHTNPIDEFIHRAGRTGRRKGVNTFTFLDLQDKWDAEFCTTLTNVLRRMEREHEVPMWMKPELEEGELSNNPCSSTTRAPRFGGECSGFEQIDYQNSLLHSEKFLDWFDFVPIRMRGWNVTTL